MRHPPKDAKRARRVLVVCIGAALAGGMLAAAAVTSAQGQGDYTTTTTSSTSTATTTTTTPDASFELRLKAKKQKLDATVDVRASCPVEACFVHATGKLTVKAGKKKRGKIATAKKKKYTLGEQFAGIPAGSSAQMALPAPKKGVKKGKKALKRKKGKVRAPVTLEGADSVGNLDTVKQTVKFKKKKKKK